MKNVFKISFILALSGLLSRIFGSIRDIWIARVFGLQGEGSWNIEAYYLAFRLPDLLYQILIAGIISVSLIPVYYKISEEKRSLFLAQTSRILVFIFLAFALALYLTMPFWIPLLAPGLDPETQDLAMQLSRWLLFSTFILGLSTLLQTIAQIQDRYWGMALSPVIYNTGALIALNFWVDDFGVYGLIYGILLGAGLSLIIQIFYHQGWRTLYHTGAKLLKKDIYELWNSAKTRFLGIMILQAMMLLDMMWLSWMKGGSIALMNYLLNIQALILGLLAVSTSTAIFNRLSQLHKDPSAWQAMVKKSFHFILAFVWPALIGLYLVLKPLLTWILPNSEKSLLSTFPLDHLAFFLSLNVVPIVMIHFFNRVYFSKNEYRTVNRLSFGLLLIYQGLLLIFFGLDRLDLTALLASFSIANYFVLLFYGLDLQKRFQFYLWEKRYNKEMFAVFTSGIMMALSLNLWELQGSQLPEILIFVLCGIFIFFASLSLQLLLFRSPLLKRP